MKDKVGKYKFLAEPFHCDFNRRLLMGHLGNHLLNAADFHSLDRGFGMNYLSTIDKTWVLSRLAIEVEEMPEMYGDFFVETWVDTAMKYFTKRNFSIVGNGEKVYGYGRSVWAMIDIKTRQPQNILEINGGSINLYIEKERECPIEPSSRVQVSQQAGLVRAIDTFYSDVDINGHVNSIKYIEHVLDLFDLDWYRAHCLKRFEVAYVAETYCGDRLNFYQEKINDLDFSFRITKTEKEGGNEAEVCRAKLAFVPK
ncbi:MAG: thioesterase [Prevotella sp.]|nr:thioesterase [Prevotella sp.]